MPKFEVHVTGTSHFNTFLTILQFQEISTPTPRGVGRNFNKKGGWGCNWPKSFREKGNLHWNLQRGGWIFTPINPLLREKGEGVQNFSGETNLMNLKGQKGFRKILHSSLSFGPAVLTFPCPGP